MPNFDKVAVRITEVAARLAELVHRLGYELSSSISPQLVTRVNIRNADIQEAADQIGVGSGERHRRFVRGRTAAEVEDEPRVRDLDERRRAAVVASGQNATSEYGLVESNRAVHVDDGEKMRDAKPLSGRHLIGLLRDLYLVHERPEIELSRR